MESLAASATAPLDMSLARMTSLCDLKWRGRAFRIVCNESKDHPSWASHLDEFVTRDLWWNIEEGDVVLDIGAEFGSYSLTALAAGASLVVAWSPPFRTASPVESQAMVLSAWENGFEDRLLVHPTGLWSERGWLTTMSGPRPPTFFRARADALAAIEGQPGYCAAFPVKTLDEYLAEAPIMVKDMPARVVLEKRKWWLKISTSGSELEILRGARGFIGAKLPNILIENHPHLLNDAESVAEEFILGLRAGYEKVGTRPHFVVSHSLYVAAEEQGAK
jgi:hypothetical protein